MTKKSRIKACAYICSTTDNPDLSTEMQHKHLVAFAEREGYEILDWFVDEGRSGGKDAQKRVEWPSMLVSALFAEWEVILCYDQPRFSRLGSSEDAGAKELLRVIGKRLVFASQRRSRRAK